MSRKEELLKKLIQDLEEFQDYLEDSEEGDSRPNYDLREMTDPRALSGLRELLWSLKK